MKRKPSPAWGFQRISEYLILCYFAVYRNGRATDNIRKLNSEHVQCWGVGNSLCVGLRGGQIADGGQGER